MCTSSFPFKFCILHLLGITELIGYSIRVHWQWKTLAIKHWRELTKGRSDKTILSKNKKIMEFGNFYISDTRFVLCDSLKSSLGCPKYKWKLTLIWLPKIHKDWNNKVNGRQSGSFELDFSKPLSNKFIFTVVESLVALTVCYFNKDSLFCCTYKFVNPLSLIDIFKTISLYSWMVSAKVTFDSRCTTYIFVATSLSKIV